VPDPDLQPDVTSLNPDTDAAAVAAVAIAAANWRYGAELRAALQCDASDWLCGAELAASLQ
jgi:hypothetical protein